jgi:hypothetical protein
MGGKMATVKPPEHKFNKKEDKMHFSWSSAVWATPSTFKLPSNDLVKLLS